MILYNWAVYKNCRIVGYVAAYSEYEATLKANAKYGRDIFLQRSCQTVSSPT
jgi:hypothetical protein